MIFTLILSVWDFFATQDTFTCFKEFLVSQVSDHMVTMQMKGSLDMKGKDNPDECKIHPCGFETNESSLLKPNFPALLCYIQ